MKVRRHMVMNVQGALRMLKGRRKSPFNHDDGKPMSAKEAKAILEEKFNDGYRVIPMDGIECEGFDKIKGCPGHTI